MPVASPFQAYKIKDQIFFNDHNSNSLSKTFDSFNSLIFSDKSITGNTFTKDKLPAIYIYYQFYINKKGISSVTKGWIADVEISDWSENKILKHEEVDDAGVLVQYNSLKKSGFYCNPIHVLYEDHLASIDTFMEESMMNPILTITDKVGVKHIISAIHDKIIIGKFLSLIKNKEVVIADGHHRYCAALRMKAENPHFKFIPAFFTNVKTNHLTVFPFHKLVKVKNNVSKASLISYFSNLCEMEKVEWSFLKTNTLPQDSIGLLLHNEAYLLHNTNSIQQVHGLNHAFNNIFPYEPLEIEYTDNIMTCIFKIEEGIADLALIMKNYSVEEILRISKEFKALPQKSTCFFPKVPQGLIIQKAGIENLSSGLNCFEDLLVSG